MKMIEELKKINERFFELYGRLHQYRENLSREQYDFMLKKLYETYREEFERIEMECEIETSREEYRLSVRRSILIPRRRWRWSRFWFHRLPNRAASLLEDEVACETEKFFSEREKRLYSEEGTMSEVNETEGSEDDVKTDTMSKAKVETQPADTAAQAKVRESGGAVSP